VTVYRGTVPDRPIIATGLRGEGAFTGRPARAGDVVEVPCDDCEGTGLDGLGYGSVPCGDCDARGTVHVRLTEDPECLTYGPDELDALFQNGTTPGWLIVGTIEP
jgi:hypothetical protein